MAPMDRWIRFCEECGRHLKTRPEDLITRAGVGCLGASDAGRLAEYTAPLWCSCGEPAPCPDRCHCGRIELLIVGSQTEPEGVSIRMRDGRGMFGAIRAALTAGGFKPGDRVVLCREARIDDEPAAVEVPSVRGDGGRHQRQQGASVASSLRSGGAGDCSGATGAAPVEGRRRAAK